MPTKEAAVNFKRRTVTTIQTHEVLTVKRRSGVTALLPSCAACPGGAWMLTPQEAARSAGVSQLTIYRWVEDGSVHFAETADGGLFVCLAPRLSGAG